VLYLKNKYQPPAEKIAEAQKQSQKRLNELKQQQLKKREQSLKEQQANSMYTLERISNPNATDKLNLAESEELIRIEKERHGRLIGQLKAAEARNRLDCYF
jgi:ATP-dependent Clp protease ATP-binding subunit ClpA